MRQFCTFFICFLVLVLPIKSFSQDEGINPKLINSYSMPQGLSHYGVTSVLEDHNGLLWVGTFDGLNYYDGFEFKTFRNTNSVHYLNSNRIRSLFQDENNTIWIGSDHGVNIYNYTIKKFKQVYIVRSKKGVKSGPIVRQILPLKNSVICVTESQGLLFFNKKTTKLENTIQMPEKTVVYKAVKTTKDKLLLATSKGLFAVDIPSKTLTSLLKKQIPRASDLAIDSTGTIYCLGNSGVALLKLDQQKEYKLKGKFFLNKKFLTVYVDKQENIWLGEREEGLTVLTTNDFLDKRKPLKQITDKKYYGLSRVSFLLPDAKSGCWVGSFSTGLYHLQLKHQEFKYSNLNTGGSKQSNSNQILHIDVLDSTNVLLNVHFKGLINFNTKTGQIEELPKNLKVFKSLTAGSLIMDQKGGQFIRQNALSGNYLYQAKGSSLWHEIRYKGLNNLSTVKMRSLIIDKHGYHWMGCNEGLFRLKIEKNGVVSSAEFIDEYPVGSGKSFKELRYVYEDPKYNFIWIGTKQDGLFRLNNNPKRTLAKMKTQQFVHSDENRYSLSSNFVSCIQRLPNGQLWIGTEQGGICEVENSQLACTFKSYTEKEGLDNNTVKSILYDKQDNLWITTNNGINEFNIKTKKFRNYSIEDGVIVSPFVSAEGYLKDGRMVFGGGNGVCYFNPDEITNEVPLSNLLLGDFKVFNQTINPLDTLNNKVILTKALNETKKIELDYNENVFSIELISLHFSNAKSNLVKYRLLPQDKEWVITTSEMKVANFNGLPPGKYTFQASTSNTKKEWSAIREIQLVINPPIWKTVWAYILYVIIVLLILFVVVKFLLRLNTLKHELHIEQIERNRIDELNKTKIRLFMNISHEFRTPLTLIVGPLQILLKMFKSNQDAFQHLNLIERQSKKMFQLVNQVQDFQKAEQSLLKLKMKSFDFTELITEVKKDFDQLAEHTEKIFKIEGEANKLFVVADKPKLEIILNNLLNNAFKFTQKGDAITLSYGIKDGELFFSVKDTGIGINQADLPHIFDRYYQSEEINTATIGSGIGLAFSKKIVELHYGKISVDSTKEEGTVFSVLLPVQVSKDDTFNENRFNEILTSESDDEKQKLHPNSFELPTNLIDKTLKELNIYYVEDNDDLRDFVYTSLSEFFNVTAFENGKKCMDKIEEEWPDLIISDILMPEMNGLELCSAIKTDVRTSHIPVLLLTSRSSIDDQVTGLESGADAYISKPFDLKHLVATTQMLLKNRQKLRERFRIDFPVEVEKKNNNKSDRVFMEKLYELMEEHLDNEELDINIFIKELHLNRTHFYQKVKAITNYTPYELLKLYRLKKAAEFIVNEKLTVSEVYLRTGFKSRTHFSRMFKEHYGVTPGKYGKEVEKPKTVEV
ncbi:hybrid sensor histidine kinase/response regulator [Flammeovirga pectinis]|uniref:histidine kinase n=2 Tax=Flammeovirga pectinis TaxID=2494373 RepID=A0A3Q9FT07_9BACT|nr:hybrid sensor histidine kinase/response regulator [Flammeovirga pectinis]